MQRGDWVRRGGYGSKRVPVGALGVVEGDPVPRKRVVVRWLGTPTRLRLLMYRKSLAEVGDLTDEEQALVMKYNLRDTAG